MIASTERPPLPTPQPERIQGDTVQGYRISMTPDLDAIRPRIGRDDVTLRIADNNGFIWVLIAPADKPGRFTARLPLEPQAHDIEALKAAIDQWQKDEE